MQPTSRNLIFGWLLLTPALVLLVGFTLFPTVATLWDSFHSTPRGRRAAVWVGGENYQTMLTDVVFWKAMSNTVLYAAVTIPASIITALGMALLVNSRIRGRAFARLAFFTPTILPMVAVANIWMFFYAPDYGLIDQILRPFGLGGNNWLGSPDTALGALIVITIWKNAGFFMIFYLAALQQVPPVLIEAAKLEGASPLQRLRRVILPMIMPTTLFVAINAVIEAFRLVDHVMTMTRGGPDNSTQLLLYYIWQTGFGYWDTAYAAALTVVLLAILALIALVQFGWADRRIFYR
ncbi:carbohydrate ABC transporter permease [Rhodobacter sp. 24-YEA-8]|uniref:carbohydrate ABC transporter permease n=1 Tax=Rhodobacter sp. 24-YEA-8 TaxID=1884310 RepID=UPI0008981072|nr:sugar ABC transporter permease [Rhodobacter sp. 24-YEA-8]SED74007.1 carbohydrate ABC transporter membrane protein 1, CUT1 family [Rhodobacter sp. 24-YEA-8]